MQLAYHIKKTLKLNMQNHKKCVVVILTFNSEKVIKENILSAKKISSSVCLVDSGSKDQTLAIAKKLSCMVIKRKFINYSYQRNWVIQYFNKKKYLWQLHLDSDEILDNAAIKSIKQAISGQKLNAYIIRRVDYFMGKRLRFSGLNPWHLRLFKSGKAKCESRIYDTHFITKEPVGRLEGLMHDKNSLTITDWIERHNKWSTLECEEIMKNRKIKNKLLAFNILNDPRAKTRLLKIFYYFIPGVGRSILYFVYRYFIRLAFLDGRVGFYFSFLQALWFRTLVDIKIFEKKYNK
jgi:glycosyltransferase involved in cell wall biosynthesis|tara:strand:- start:226 stop:1104 length:879 start_codon:yes stop_codon:yes gene_type:complete